MAEVLAPGYRFYPTEEELVGFYLHHKLAKHREADLERIIPVLDFYSYDPWQLLRLEGYAKFGKNEELFFFCPRHEKETHGGRANRITPSGYWKATGCPGFVFSSQNQVIGVKKTLVFYKGKAPTSRKTKWRMKEYKSLASAPHDGSTLSAISEIRSEFSVCRLYVNLGSMQAFDRRPLLDPTIVEMGSRNGNNGPHQENNSDINSSQRVEENEIVDDPINWEMIADLDPSWESWSSI